MAVGLGTMGLGVVFSARDEASRPIGMLRRNFVAATRDVSQSAANMSMAFDRVASGMSRLRTASSGLIRGTFQLAVGAGRVQETLAGVGFMTQASAQDMATLEDAVTRAGIETEFTGQQAAEALRSFGQAGIDAATSAESLIPALNMASASLGELTPEETAGLASIAMRAFGESADDVGFAMDRMSRTTMMSAMRFRDLPLALGISARGAGVLNASLDETLIALGLVRNVIPTVERGATAVAASMERMVRPEVQQRLHDVGVEVLNADRTFRPFLDIISDLTPALGRMTEANRSQFLQTTFGNEAMAGLNAIIRQVTEGIQTQSGEMVRGAEAIAYLRGTVEQSEGTLQALLDILGEQLPMKLRLLGGSIEMLGNQIGPVFGDVFAPLVQAATDALNMLISVVRSIPAPVLRAMGVFVLVGGAIGVIVGSVGAAAAGIGAFVVLLGESLLLIGGIVAGVMVAMLPLFAAGAAVVAAAYAIRRAYEENLGGVGDFVDGWVSRLTLLWNMLGALFTGQPFSDEIQRQMEEAGNEGVVRFGWQLWDLWQRAQEVWAGLQSGFQAVWDTMGPVFEELRNAFTELMGVIGSAITGPEGIVGAAAGLPTGDFREMGRSIGESLGNALRTIVSGVTRIIEFVTRMIRIWRGLERVLGPVFDIWISNLRNVWRVIESVWNVVEPLVRALQWVGRVVNPLWWAARGLEHLGREREEPADVTREAREVIELGRYDRERRESRERSEPGVERPAVAERGVDDELLSTLRSIDERLSARRGERQPIRLHTTLQTPNFDVWADVIQDVETEQTVMTGELA